MDEPQAFPYWLFFLFPIFFAAMWLGITGMLAEIGGWSELARLYREPEGMVRAPVQSFRMATLDLRRRGIPLPTNYSNCAIVELAVEGLHLRPWAIFRFRHPPLLIPWTQMEQVQPGTFLFFRVLTVSPRGVGTRIRMYGAPAEAVEHAWRQLAAPAARPVPV